jgi:hypothetical protein
MSRTKATRQKQATASAKAPKRSRKAPEPQPEPEVDRGAAISEGMKELADVRTKARAKRNGTPAKPLIFSEWLKALLAGKPFDVEAMARKYPEIKESSIRSWSSYWLRNGGTGPGYPSNARGKEKEIKAAIKKHAVA